MDFEHFFLCVEVLQLLQDVLLLLGCVNELHQVVFTLFKLLLGVGLDTYHVVVGLKVGVGHFELLVYAVTKMLRLLRQRCLSSI